jgi:hypothetical protein
MLSVPRFARIFLLALVLVTVPTAFIFYPSSPDKASGEVSLEKGGIDSEHWREPVPPPQQGAQGTAEEDDEERAWADGAGKAVDSSVLDKENVAGDTGALAKEPEKGAEPKGAEKGTEYSVPQDVISGAVIMPHLGNATAKAELGRAAWRVLHLMTLRYPEVRNPKE